MAIFDQATWLISRGQAPFVTVRGLHLLAEHFSAVLYLLAPLYWLWPSPKMLLVVQTGALSLGALPVYGLSRRRLQSAPLALLFGLAYLLYPPMQWSNSFEFHPDTLATPCLLGALYFLNEKRWGLSFLLLGLAALCKETVGLTIFALGIYVLLTNRRNPNWRMGVLTMGLGVLALGIALGAVSHFNGGRPSLFFLLYSQYGNSPSTIASYVLRHPLRVGADFGSADNRLYLFQLLYPVMFLSLLAPEVLVIALPSLGLHLLSTHSIMHTIYFQYTALTTPFVFASAILGVERARHWGDRRTGALLGFCLVLGLALPSSQRPLSSRTPHLPPVLPPAQAAETQRLLDLIPAGASVSTQVALMPRLAHRRDIYLFPNPFQPAAWGYGELAMRQMGAEGFTAPDRAALERQASRCSVEYVALCPPTPAFPLLPHDPLYFNFTVPVLCSPAYGIIGIGEDTLILKRGADHARGLRLLAQRSGEEIRSGADLERALRAWTARQPTIL